MRYIAGFSAFILINALIAYVQTDITGFPFWDNFRLDVAVQILLMVILSLMSKAISDEWPWE